jgi:CoA-transferase family III
MTVAGNGSPAQLYAEMLLALLHSDATVRDGADPIVDWAASGAMALTGETEGPPLVVPGPAVALRGALLALRALAPGVELPGVALLGERAAFAGLVRGGATAAGGATRLLGALDGTVAIALARDEDRDLVPALVAGPVGDPWEAVEDWVARSGTATVRERCSLLGLPCGVSGEAASEGKAPWRVLVELQSPAPVRDRPVIVDLSALWAGPLCASILGSLGCEVIKVEDPSRPDGARRGPAAFYESLHEGARTELLNLRSTVGLTRLRKLIVDADVVIESSRPRALEQIGLGAEQIVRQSAKNLTWVSITAHGRDQPERVGYGDDAAVAGGLVARSHRGPVFVADAVADPLTGVHAALLAWSGIRTGGARLVDVAMSRIAAAAAAAYRDTGSVAVRAGDSWSVDTDSGRVAVAAPATRTRRRSP